MVHLVVEVNAIFIAMCARENLMNVFVARLEEMQMGSEVRVEKAESGPFNCKAHTNCALISYRQTSESVIRKWTETNRKHPSDQSPRLQP